MPNYSNHQDVIELLRRAQQSDEDLRQEARDAQLFIHKKDGQWEPYWWNINTGKPRYTFDMTGPVVDQIAGEIEQADFDIRVSPASGEASKQDAKTFDGLIRNIENQSNASSIFSSAARSMITGGLDGWRVVTKYVDDDSFDQDLAIERIPDFIDRVWFDEASVEPDRSDSRWCVVLHAPLTEDYKRRWPEGSEQGISQNYLASAYYDKPDVIMVGELLYRKPYDRELVLMNNGDVYEVNEDYNAIIDELAQEGIVEQSRRKRKGYRIHSRYFDASDWLEPEKETVFSQVPVIPTYGNFSVFENKVLFSGAVRSLMDYQRVFNYSESRAVAEVALAPRAKIPMTEAMMEGHTDELAILNVDDSPVLPFNPDPQLPGYIPQQVGGAQVNQGLTMISANMKDGIARAAGLFAANMGEQVNDQSGVAIKALQDKGNIGTSKYFKAQEIAICQTAKVLINAIPRVYDTERTIRILGEDGAISMATLNEQVLDNETGRIVTVNDLSKGKYDVTCSAGPSFQNKQQETVAGIMEMANVDPSIIQENGDILFSNITAPGMDLIAERKRNALFQAGLIPEEQMTDEEFEELQVIQQQPPQPDAMMVAAEAEMQKAQAEHQKNEMAMQKAAMEFEIKQNDLMLKAQKQELDLQAKMLDLQRKEQELEMKFLEQQQKAGLDAAKTMADIENTEADTDKKEAETAKIMVETGSTVKDMLNGSGEIEINV
jgi:hypothetical protein